MQLLTSAREKIYIFFCSYIFRYCSELYAFLAPGTVVKIKAFIAKDLFLLRAGVFDFLI